MTEWDNLLKLHNLDMEIDRVTKLITKENHRTEKLRHDINKEIEQLLKNDSTMKEVNLKKKKSETELNEINEKISSADLKLKSPGLSPNVYMSLSREIESLRSKIPALENTILTDMEKAESLKKEISSAKKLTDGRKLQFADVKKEVMESVSKLKKEEDLLRTQRNQLALNLKGYAYEVYEKLRLTKKGKVIFDLDKPGCPSCGLKLPGGVISIMMSSGTLETCPNCGIFLHWTGISDGVVS
ncbi:MAG: hypothetical protein HQM10_05175 [Candidatus Riflebacteria bacterium]|nr:hypothetical protein [Candidatus Riflebacteria bacterium]